MMQAERQRPSTARDQDWHKEMVWQELMLKKGSLVYPSHDLLAMTARNGDAWKRIRSAHVVNCLKLSDGVMRTLRWSIKQVLDH